MGKKLKTAQSYQEKNLHPISAEEISFLRPNDFNSVKLHQDKAIIHTSKCITTFHKKMKIDTSFECITFQHTPSKSLEISRR